MKKSWRKNDKIKVESGKRKADAQQWTMDYRLWTVALLIVFGCTQNKKQDSAEKYVCPMHPTVVKDTPGSCPVCGMDLVLRKNTSNEMTSAEDLNYLLKPVNEAVISSIKTVTAVQKSMRIKTNWRGVIAYDTRNITTVSSRLNGRIEKLFLKSNLQPVRRGQKILEIYSPELLTAQRDLLYLLKADKGNADLIDGAREKLQLLGASNAQIDQLIATRQESTTFSVFSPADGYVINSAETPGNADDLEIREGMYVTTGQTIFRVANPRSVWAEFDLYSGDRARVKVNDPIGVTAEGADEREARVDFLQPLFKEGQSFAKVRVYLHNDDGKLRVGQLVSASWDKPTPDAMWIPLSAQLNLGTRRIVFARKEGVFRPLEIATGNQSENWIEVVKGIAPTDSIAYNAQFMIDSESFIKVKN